MKLIRVAAWAVVVVGGLAWYLKQPADPSSPADSPALEADYAPAPAGFSADQQVDSNRESGETSLRIGVAQPANAGPFISGRAVTVPGTVTRLLADDRDGSPHQRFVIRMARGQTLLVAHNLDLAPRLEGLRVGDTVEVHGVYEWNDKGGVLHWTHDDPEGQHAAGYIDWNGRRYQ